jgi:hypothetical protein
MKGGALLWKAMRAAGYNDVAAFAVDVLNTDPRRARRVSNGEAEIGGTTRLVCYAILERPALAQELKAVKSSPVYRDAPPEAQER